MGAVIAVALLAVGALIVPGIRVAAVVWLLWPGKRGGGA